jgi:hypothetical protein
MTSVDGKVLIGGDIDAAITVEGAVKGVSLKSVKAQGDFGGSVNATGGKVADVNVGGDLTGSLTALSLGNLTVGGNMEGAHVQLNQPVVPETPKLLALSKVTVKGWMATSRITSLGNIGTVTVGGMSGSTVFAGVSPTHDTNAADGVWDLPDPASEVVPGGATINAVTVKGQKDELGAWQDSFVNSNVAASQFGSLSLFHPHTDNGGAAFGAAACLIKKYSVKFGDETAPWACSNLDDPNPDLKEVDFLFRIV